MICPFCDHANIAGADTCEKCGHSLSDLHPPVPATEVERALLRDQLSELNPKTPIVVEPCMPIRQAIKMMVDYKIGCVVVVDNSRVVGIFSERDALLKIGTRGSELGDKPVSDFMTSPPRMLEMDAKIAFAVQRMDLGGFRHIPVVDEQQRAVGVVSVRDILDYLTEKMTSQP